MKKIAFVNQKGGVGKTTTTVNLGSSLAKLGKKVLLVDIDPQANMTENLEGAGFEIAEDMNTIYELFIDELDIKEAIYESGIENLDLIPSDIRLANAELELAGVMERESILKRCFQNSNLDYDYILFDCNPSLGLLTINSLVATEEIIIPMQPAMFSVTGIEQLIDVINLIQENMNPELYVRGVLLTQFDARTNISKEFESELREIFGDKLFKTIIHRNVKISEAQAEQLPINIYNDKARGAKEYMALAEELVESE